MTCRNRTAFTLLELILMVSILGILLSIAVPRLKFDTLARYKADTVARKIVTDLRRTRSLAIGDAATNTDGYRLEFTGSSPYSNYRIVNEKTSGVVETFSISSGVSVTTSGGAIFKFGPLGNILQGGTKITVSAEGRIFGITVVNATGTIKCVRE